VQHAEVIADSQDAVMEFWMLIARKNVIAEAAWIITRVSQNRKQLLLMKKQY